MSRTRNLALALIFSVAHICPLLADVGEQEPRVPQVRGPAFGADNLGEETAHSPAFSRAQTKLATIAENGRAAEPAPLSTTLTAAEWNAYLNEGGVKLPPGLSEIALHSQPGIIHGQAIVDFDQLTAGKTRNNPLLGLFSGKHLVTATARASCVNGKATIHVQSVAFDGAEIPPFALEFFAAKFLRPKYGSAIGMDSTFAVKNRIDSAVVGEDRVVITQK
jgi:hypothetical protein